jgi:hypothetical protein
VGGLEDFLMFPKMPDYSLPFKIWGYFNLRDHVHIEAPGLGIECEPNTGYINYHIIHIPSDKRLFTLTKMSRAELVIKLLSEIGNWDKPWDEVRGWYDNLPSEVCSILLINAFSDPVASHTEEIEELMKIVRERTQNGTGEKQC